MNEKRQDYISWMNILWRWQSWQACAQGSELPGGFLHRQRGHKILSMGYNGFPCGCSDDEFPWSRTNEDPLKTKYVYVTHSELNAILNYRGGSLEGSKLYVSLFPCNECAKAIIQAGIRTVIYDSDKYAGTPSNVASKRMLQAAGVEVRQYHPTHRKIEITV